MMGGMTTIHIQCFDNGTYEVYRISRVDCCVKVVLCCVSLCGILEVPSGGAIGCKNHLISFNIQALYA